MTYRPRKLVTLAAWLTLGLQVTSCATPSPSLPVVPEKLTIPQPPLVEEPKPSGFYWAKVCDFRKTLQERLSLKLPPGGPC